jgi:hypothetical protein
LRYAISSERTLEVFYEQLRPWATAFMALFGRDHLPGFSSISLFGSSFFPYLSVGIASLVHNFQFVMNPNGRR